MNNFNEFELLTLREGLFAFQKYNWNKISDEEFNKIDDKIKAMVKNLK